MNKIKKIMSMLTAAAVSVTMLAGLSVTAGAKDTTEYLPVKGHTAIVGAQKTAADYATKLWFNSYSNLGGAGELYFELDSNFDSSKVKSAKLQLYFIAKDSRNYSGTLQFFALNEKTVPSNSDLNYDVDPVKVYNTKSGKRYTYSGNPIAEYAVKTGSGTADPTVGEYTDIDISDYIKSLSDAEAGAPLYIGLSQTDFVFSGEVGAYGNEHPAKIEIIYTDEVQKKYEINYKLGDEIIKTDSKTVIPGTKIVLDKMFEEGGKRYYKDDSRTELVVSETDSENTIDVSVREAQTYTGVKAVSKGLDENKTFATADVLEGDGFPYAYSKCLTDSSRRVTAVTGVNSYSQTKTPSESNQTYEVEYSKYTGTAYFVDHEDITNSAADEASSNYSGSKATRAIYNGVEAFTVKESGFYTITVAGSRRSSTDGYFGVFDKSTYTELTVVPTIPSKATDEQKAEIQEQIDAANAENVPKKASNSEVALLEGYMTASRNYALTTGTIKKENVFIEGGTTILVTGDAGNTYVDYIMAEKTSEKAEILPAVGVKEDGTRMSDAEVDAIEADDFGSDLEETLATPVYADFTVNAAYTKRPQVEWTVEYSDGVGKTKQSKTDPAKVYDEAKIEAAGAVRIGVVFTGVNLNKFENVLVKGVLSESSVTIEE